MSERTDVAEALGRAGKRALYHLIQAAVESLKAVEAVIEEIGNIGQPPDRPEDRTTRIDVE